MDGSNRHLLPERNPKTHALHRREVFWQIMLPLLIGILFVLAAIAAIVFFATQPASELGRWADVSLIWLILPSLFIALIILIILIGFVYAITLLLRLTPRYARIVQLYFEIGKARISQVSNLAIEPILRIRSLSAVLRRFGRWGSERADQH